MHQLLITVVTMIPIQDGAIEILIMTITVQVGQGRQGRQGQRRGQRLEQDNLIFSYTLG